MPGALLEALTCVRCGSAAATGEPDRRCRDCGTRWAAASSPTVTQGELSALAGVVRAGIGRRALAHLVDVALVAVPVGAGVSLALGGGTHRVGLMVVLIAVVLGLVAGQLTALLTTGRTVGRRLLSLRTVDDLAGTPVRAGRFVAQVTGSGLRRRTLTADLRRGRDPWRPRLAPPPLPRTDGRAADLAWSGSGVLNPTTGVPELSGTGSRPAAGPRSSVGIELDTGERYEIHGALLIGRSPVDPTPGAGRMLLAWPDLSRRIAKTHALLEWSGTVLWVTDLASAGGTTVVSGPAAGADEVGTRLPLAPGVRTAAAVGARIECGGRTIAVVPGA